MQMPTHILADASALIEGVRIAIEAISLITSVALGVALFWLRGNKEALNGLQAKVDRLGSDVETKATQLIEIKLAAAVGGNAALIGQMGDRVKTIEDRLQSGDRKFSILTERDHKLEVEILRALSELKDTVATKSDLDHLRQEFKR